MTFARAGSADGVTKQTTANADVVRVAPEAKWGGTHDENGGGAGARLKGPLEGTQDG